MLPIILPLEKILINEASNGQFPEAMILSCIDSRVLVEDIFQKNVGELFVGRIAGNTCNLEMLGSLEYACKVSGAKVIVVLGHSQCGAISSAIKDVKLGNITPTLIPILPAVQTVTDSHFHGDKNYNNPKFIEAVCQENVRKTINYITENSLIIKNMESLGKIAIVGAVFELKTGKVTFID